MVSGTTDLLNDLFKEISKPIASAKCALLIVSDKYTLPLIVRENECLVFGHFEIPSRTQIDFRLFTNLDEGVSRQHAMIYFNGHQLLIVDMNSTNGTYLAGKKLEANTPIQLKNRDDLRLGKLELQVMFKIEKSSG